jgi:hypothetical protein
VHGAVEAQRSEPLGLALARPEAGTPKQPLCLGGSEVSVMCGDVRQTVHGSIGRVPDA